MTSSPRRASAAAAASPERSSPSTRNGPGGSGGRGFTAGMLTALGDGSCDPSTQETDCWNSVKPIAEQTAATIQKRRMIFVSDHAMSSKW